MPKISNVYQDKKSSKWYFVASLGYDRDGKRVQHWERGFNSQREAKQTYDEYMSNYSKTAVKINSTMSYEEFLETYYLPDYKGSVSQHTYDTRKSMIDKHFSYFNKRKLKEIDAPMLKRWQNELLGKYESSYVRLLYGMFQKSLDLAVNLGLLQFNIAKKVGNVKKSKKKVDFWTLEEFQKVVATFDISDYYEHYSFIMIWLLYMSGLRFGECQALEWKDVDFDKQTLTVSKNMYYKSATEFYIVPPKTKAGNRVIALDDKTIKYLKDWLVVQKKNLLECKWILSYNGIPTNKYAPMDIITKHSKMAGVHRIRTHALRHSHASMLISMGVSALVVRDRLGHEDIKTTLGTYGHLYPNTNFKVANQITNLLNTFEDENKGSSLSTNKG